MLKQYSWYFLHTILILFLIPIPYMYAYSVCVFLFSMPSFKSIISGRIPRCWGSWQVLLILLLFGVSLQAYKGSGLPTCMNNKVIGDAVGSIEGEWDCCSWIAVDICVHGFWCVTTWLTTSVSTFMPDNCTWDSAKAEHRIFLCDLIC
jgi:hypothetical protein